MRRILYLLIILLISASGNQTLGQMNKSEAQSQALSLKIITKVPSVCYRENLSIEMELINKSKDKIAINSESLWSTITFRAYKPSKLGVNDTRVLMINRRMQSHPNDDFVILKSGEVYKKTAVVPIDNQFFRQESKVEFDVSYFQLEGRNIDGVSLWKGDITSNKLKLQIKPCNSDEKTAGRELR